MTRARYTLLSAGIFVLSAAVIFLELLSMRLLSFMLWHHLAYMVLSVAMLGFGASGAWLSASRVRRDPMTLVTWSASLFALTCLLGFAVLTRIRLDTFELGAMKLAKLGVYYAVLLVPYFFAGSCLAVIFRAWPRRATTLYAVNLVGSGLGCWAFLYGLPLVGGPGAVIEVALAGVLAAGLWQMTRSVRRGALLAGAFVLLHVLHLAGGQILPFHPAPSKSLARYLDLPGAVIEHTSWTPLARIDVVSAPRAPHPFMGEWVSKRDMRTITIDGDANTWLFRHPALDEVDTSETVRHLAPNSYTLAFLMRPSPDEVLVIGPGGGNEVAMALAADASHVTGVELNAAILVQSVERYADMFGHLYQSERATAVVAEGRSWIRRADERYDVIQMSGVDTWSGLSSGAYVLSENYLYTVEAARDMLERLEPRGILSLGRFRLSPPRESLRLFANVLRAMRELGWEEPEEHVVVASVGHLDQARILVGRSAFDARQVRRLRELVGRADPDRSLIWYAPGMGDELAHNPFVALARAVAAGPEAERRFYEAYRYDVTPVYDDRPFFFEYYKWSHYLDDMVGGGRGGQIGASKPIGLSILLFLVVQVTVLCVVFIFAPLVRLRKDGRSFSHKPLVVGGFGALGLGFMFVEVGLMQKLVLFLGHPSTSISVSLFAVLVGSGLGSFTAGAIPWTVERRLAVSVCAVAALSVISALALGPLTSSLLGLPAWARQVIAAGLVMVLAFPMGMPFPLSLSRTGALGPAAVPWAWGINGGASVLGSILCIVMAMALGFRAVLLFAGLLYLAALPCLLGLSRRASDAPSPRR
jgi:hypothetical protein